MKDNKLPIKIISKREIVDERKTEGGGGSEPPSFVLSGKSLKLKAELLQKDLVNLKNDVKESFQKYRDLPVVMKAKINEDATAKSHREELQKLIVNNDATRVFGLSEDYELLVRVDNLAELNNIERNINDLDRNSLAISGIEYMKIFQPVVDLSNIDETNKDNNYKIRLQDFNNKQLNEYVEKIFLQILKNNNIKFLNKTKYTKKLVIYKVTCDSIDSLESLADFTPVASIEPMPKFAVGTDSFFDDSVFEVPKYEDEVKYPTVGVLDSGIDRLTQLGQWTMEEGFTSVPSKYADYSHGTFVGGIIAFGDLLEDKKYTGVNGCRLFDANIIPDKTKFQIDEDDLVDSIREAIDDANIEQGLNIKVWNLSLGSIIECSLNKFSDFGIALDSIQKEYDILIVKSAGNCKNFLSGKPVSRIARGADSVRALTVGSIAHEKSVNDLSDLNHTSPFSRIGPGPMNIIKPELVHYGGNAGIKNGKLCFSGVNSFSRSGNVIKNIGTSFSTPRVSAIAASLSNKINEEFDPLLTKALMIHSAKYPIEVEMDINDKLNELGFGIPKTSDEILFNDKDEITLVIRDSLTKGEYIEIADFPYPKSLVDEGSAYEGQVFLTVVADPILAESENAEYCQSDVEVKFGTYDEKEFRDTSIPRIKNELGIVGNKNLLTSSLYSKKKSPKDKKEFATTERMKIKYSDKYYPVKKYAVDLSELTAANKEKYTETPKLWYMRIEGLYRKFAEELGKIKKQTLTQEFCVILTIRDPKKRGKVYEEVVEHLDSYNFIHRDINVTQNIDISIED
ncbi:S8 family peptidase [Clostridium sp. DJ247]|uniref:S8 family peptidase n=1 Tax=Clostridium sp. DJ247 TaxID=2726188 RepID=UPI001629C4C0|nr:S8 family peptidase [Clostridium sp. DJ247]MBC2580584.1 S8 family peptidase [Clostridium sp. DJ247]